MFFHESQTIQLEKKGFVMCKRKLLFTQFFPDVNYFERNNYKIQTDDFHAATCFRDVEN